MNIFYLITAEQKIQFIIDLLKIVTWPITLLILLIFFRKYFISALSRLGSFQAGTSGFTMTFDQKITEAKQLLKGIQPKNSAIGNTSTYFSKLLEMKLELKEKLVHLATTNNVNATNKTHVLLCDELQEIGIITIQKSTLIKTFLDLANSADATLSEKNFKVTEELFNSILL
mgnify:CR=1 FL=1